MIGASLEWLASAKDIAPATRAHPVTAAEDVCTAEVEPGVRETASSLGSSHGLFGIVTSPTRARFIGRTVIFLNVGAQHRIGLNRLWVSFAREWAKRGVVSLRFDFSGLGDSKPRPGMQENLTYGAPGEQDIADAAAYLRTTWDASNVDVVGVCMGAYFCVKAAALGAAVDGFVSVNQEIFTGDASAGQEASTSFAWSETRRYRDAAHRIESWKKLLRGEVKLLTAGQIFGKRIADLAGSHARGLGALLGIPIRSACARELRTIAQRKIAMCFVASKGEPALDLLFTYGSPDARALERRGALILETIDGPDHTFTPVWSHRVLAECLARQLRLPAFTGTPDNAGPAGTG